MQLTNKNIQLPQCVSNNQSTEVCSDQIVWQTYLSINQQKYVVTTLCLTTSCNQPTKLYSDYTMLQAKSCNQPTNVCSDQIVLQITSCKQSTKLCSDHTMLKTTSFNHPKKYTVTTLKQHLAINQQKYAVTTYCYNQTNVQQKYAVSTLYK